MRVGIGYDMHPLVEGRRLVLGGVVVPHPLGLDGHSDADVLVHAIMDALLGAAGLGDIGQRFPPGDPSLRDISSLVLLQRTADLVLQAGLRVCNVDATIIAERPRLSPFRDEMRHAIAQALGAPVTHINVKFTTTNGLGLFAAEGIAAQAIAALEEA